jgi:general secretion pathway protein D
MKKIIIFLMFGSLLFASVCDKKLFTLHIANPIKLNSVLSDLVNECGINIIIKDKDAQKALQNNIRFINVKNVTFKDLLDVIFQNANLFYEYKNNTVTLSYNKTKTFRVDFIPNNVSGVSNIDSTDNKVKNDYTFDFWDNLKSNIVQILQNVNSNDYKPPIIDKNSGLVTVTGNKNQIEEIEKYINDLNNRLHKEVLIDVKIYSVTLSDSHKTGIDWNELSISLSDSSVPLRASNILGKSSVFKQANFNSGGILNFLAQFGNVNSISNPKIVTLNNQKALISVGDTIYYKYASEVTTDNNGNPNTQYTIDSKFVGVLLDITPQISDNGEIILSINPKISTFKDATQLTNVNRDMPPDTQDNTMISVVKLKNNDTLVLGGLITDDKQLKVNGVPVLKEIPIIKYLFSSREKISTKKELVFIITPHIIDLNTTKTLKDYGFKTLPSIEDLNVR